MTSFSLGNLYSLLTNLWRLCHASGQVGGYVSPRVVWGEEDRGHPGLLREARPQPHGHRVPRCERQKRYYKFEFDKVKLSWSLVFRLHMFICAWVAAESGVSLTFGAMFWVICCVRALQYFLQAGDLFSKISSISYNHTEEKCKSFVIEITKVIVNIKGGH